MIIKVLKLLLGVNNLENRCAVLQSRCTYLERRMDELKKEGRKHYFPYPPPPPDVERDAAGNPKNMVREVSDLPQSNRWAYLCERKEG
jgi:hypothetical protein